MSDNLDRVKDRIRKMLNLAKDDSAAAGEIDNALRFAQQLMAQHHLSEDDIVEGEPMPVFDPIKAEYGRTFVSVGKKIYAWEDSLSGFCAKFVGGVKVYNDCGEHLARTANGVAMLENGKPVWAKRVAFYGVAEDSQLAAELFHELRTTIIASARLKFGSVYKGDGGAYSEGFVQGLNTKLATARDEERRIANEAGGRALMIVGSRSAIVFAKAEAAEKFATAPRDKGGLALKLYSGRGRYGAYGSSSARSEGITDGQRSSVSAQRTAKIGHG